MSDTIYDVAIIGGSFAGLTAALHLARARRTVALFDNGKTRNRFSAAAHNFIGMDGLPPAEVRFAGRHDVLAYPSVTLFEETVTSVVKDREFSLSATSKIKVKRILLTHGMTDILPDIDGLSACWGKSVLQCPFCHGYEVADRPTGMLLSSPDMADHVLMLQNWSADMILFTNGHNLSDAVRTTLGAKGIALKDGRVTALQHGDGQLSNVILETGERISREALYITADFKLSSDIATQLGCETIETPFGYHLKTDNMMQTSVAGVFAAGDITRMWFGANMAVGDGAIAGSACARSLIYDQDGLAA